METKTGFTKGDWKVEQQEAIAKLYGNGAYTINTPACNIAIVFGEKEANLICSAVNNCKVVCPSNPQAVAESIKGMYEATKIAKSLVNTVLYFHPDDTLAQSQKAIIDKALARAERG